MAIYQVLKTDKLYWIDFNHMEDEGTLKKDVKVNIDRSFLMYSQILMYFFRSMFTAVH